MLRRAMGVLGWPVKEPCWSTLPVRAGDASGYSRSRPLDVRCPGGLTIVFGAVTLSHPLRLPSKWGGLLRGPFGDPYFFPQWTRVWDVSTDYGPSSGLR